MAEPMTDEEVAEVVANLYTLHLSERGMLDRIYEYTKGLRGAPEVPESAGAEVKTIANLSVRNMLPLVRDSFVQNLSVTGYRPAAASDNDPAWAMWQRNRMDARQAEVFRPAVTYGASYVAALPGDRGPRFYPRSPRKLLAVYDDPGYDLWPQYALETWISKADAKPRRRGRLLDDEYIYDLELGEVPREQGVDPNRSFPLTISAIADPRPHGGRYDGKPVCPVVRFVAMRDEDDRIVGEIAPLIKLQKAVNEVNFDRMIVARFGAFPQKVITGWQGSADEEAKASAKRVWSFEDPDVKAFTLDAASLTGYNDVLQEMSEFVAMVAQISPSQVTGKIVNVSAEALAAAEANQQRKLAAMRDSFGESVEQLLRLGAEMDGDAETAADSGAEVIWRDTEARSFPTVVDGVTKLSSVGVPVEELLFMVPGMTQQKMQTIRQALRAGQVSDLVSTLRASATAATADPTVNQLASRTTPPEPGSGFGN